MSDKPELAALCRKIAATPLTAKYPTLFPGRIRLQSVSERAGGNHEYLSRADSGNIRATEKKMFNFINRRLGHIEVNPHAQESTRALTTVYAHGGLNNCEYPSANLTPAATEAFIDDLVIRAQMRSERFTAQIEDSNLGSGLELPANTILMGPRGCGKTFFLNHLLAKHSSRLDAAKVLWVRLNIVKRFGSDGALSHRIWAQTTKIILRYYDPDSDFFDKSRAENLRLPIKRHIEQFIATNTSAALQESSLRKWAALCNSFMKRNSVEPVFSPESFPEDLCQECFNFVLAAHFGVIVAIDGLDLLDFIPEAEERYNNLLDGCEQLNTPYEKVAATYLFVVRNTSTTMLNRLLQQSPFQTQPPAMYEVSRPSLASIVDARLKYLRQALPAQLREFSEAPVGREQTIEYWQQHLETFREYLYNQIGSEMDRLNFFDANLRCAMQVIQAKYRLFLDEEVRHSYVLTEVLTTRGKAIPTQSYRYQFTSGRLVRSLASASMYDSHFLPSLFAPPSVVIDKGADPGLYDTLSPMKHLLVSLRILQLLDDYGRSRGGHVEMSVQVMAGFLEKYLGYQSSMVLVAIEELVLYECAIFSDMERVRPCDTIVRKIAITPKGHALYSGYLFDLSYLALAAMLTATGDKSDNGYFTACSPFVRTKTTLWIATKLRNGLSLLRLVEHTNHLEAVFFNKAVGMGVVAEGHKEMLDAAKTHMFAFAKAADEAPLRKAVLGGCEKVISSLLDESTPGDPKARPVLDSVKRYAANWC
jgi:hypothetical protein